MSSLLDNHPSVASTPDCVLMGFYEFWTDFGDLPSNELIDTFVDQFATLFIGSKPSKVHRSANCYGDAVGFNTLGEARDQTLSADIGVFRNSMLEMLPDNATVTRRLFFQTLHVAYANAIGHRLETGAIISFGLHTTPRHAATAFADDFPDCRFLHMARDPIQTLGSQFRAHVEAVRLGLRTYDPTVPSDVTLTRFFSGKPALEWVKFQSRVVRLEDLHRQPKKTMMAVCGWLGIPWDDSLMQSTMNGLKYWNDNTSAHQVSGFSEAIVSQRHEAYITRFDRFRYTLIFSPRFSRMDYFDGSPLMRQFPIFLFLSPLILLPFRTERIMFRGAPLMKCVKNYVSMRLRICQYILKPHDIVPMIF
ncbi:sulfotransferase [bacterium SCSIO 12827]|nr:sulfotransferase [bacterium SCSIO 12827]